MRQSLAVLAVTLLAAFGAVVLGEYALEGVVGVVSAILFGLALGEVALAIAKRPTRLVVGAATAAAVVGEVWALWISSNHFRSPLAFTGVAGVFLAGGAAAGWLLSGRGGPRRSTGPTERAEQPTTGETDEAGAE